jgi:hypothetical protein
MGYYRREICKTSLMKKKENLWELLRRLDEEAGQFNIHLSEANRYFDEAAKKTRGILMKHEKDVHDSIRKLRKTFKSVIREDRKKKGKKNKYT